MDENYFGNASKCYEIAYNNKNNESCRVNASKLLTKNNIKLRLNKYLNEYINDTIVDRELASIIRQNSQLSPKIQAIREYNNLKQRTENKTEISFNKYEWNDYSDAKEKE